MSHPSKEEGASAAQTKPKGPGAGAADPALDPARQVCAAADRGGPCLPHPEQPSSRGLNIPEARPGLPHRQRPQADCEATSQPLRHSPHPRKVGFLNC